MYFKNFPQIFYNFDDLGMRVMRDITANVRPLTKILENAVYYNTYDIKSDETPEIIAERLYGNPLFHWILMLVNEKYDYLEDWPMPEWKLEEYITKKYGAGNENNIHVLFGRPHYITPTGRICESNYDLATPVTNDTYERELNDAKRHIRVVQPALISVFVKDLQEAFPA